MWDEILTPKEMAEYLGFSLAKVYRKLRSGELPGAKIGRVVRFKRDLVDVSLYLRARRWNEKQREEYRLWAERFSEESRIPIEDILDREGARERRERRNTKQEPAA